MIKFNFNSVLISGIFVLLSSTTFAQSKYILKVHFLYGSKPIKGNETDQQKDFGGILGGHVGVEVDSNEIFNFLPAGDLHVFSKKKDKNSHFAIHSRNQFYQILGSSFNGAKKMIISIPITEAQKLKYDSLTQAYLQETPYDYAFFGMRCGAAAYDVLSQLGIVKKFRKKQLIRKIFYPRKLRKRLLRKAKSTSWKIDRFSGASYRKWEGDFEDEEGLHRKKM